MSAFIVEKITDMYLRFLRDCFVELSPEDHADFWTNVGNVANAQNPYMSFYDIDKGFRGNSKHSSKVLGIGHLTVV